MAHYHLTYRAFSDLKNIYDYSLDKWGQNIAECYLSDMYNHFSQLATNPELGKLRQARSYPFYMSPIGKHFVVYEHYGQDIIITTILHTKRNIENIISGVLRELKEEIQTVRETLN